MNRHVIILFALLLMLAILAACERRQMVDEPPAIQQVEYEALMVGMLDMSGSYLDTIRHKAFPFFSLAADRFFRERLGADRDKIVISQLSGNARSLLWDGSPRALRNQFGSAGAFQRFLDEKSSPAGSRIHDGISDALEYILDYPGVKEGKTRVSLFVFSDMDENFPEPEKSRARLLQLLAEYSRVKGCIGMYWVDQRFVPVWRRHLRDAGVKHFVVESEIVADPSLPVFDN